MSKVLDRLRKKRGHAVTIGDETFHVRSMTIGELRRAEAMEKTSDERTGFIVGCVLCSGPEGEPEIPREPDEADAVWAARVLETLTDVPSQTITAIINGMNKIDKAVPLETITKN